MRSFVIGLVLLLFLSLTVLSFRPGGLRRQLSFAGRRLRIVLVLGGVYIFASTVIRLAFQQGPVLDYGLPILAIVLVAAFMILGRDPATSAGK